MKISLNRIVFLLSTYYFFCFYSCTPPQTQPAPKISAKLVASEGEKKVITSGYGKNPDEALTQALRNAVEEAVGTYMTSTTRIENDDIIEDKILALSRGFIKDFKKLSEMKVEGETKVTVSAIITGTQILEALKASGVKVKIEGQKMFQQFASFDRQMDDEYKVISEVLKGLPTESPLDYILKVSGEPVRVQSRGQKKYRINVKVTGNINQNYKNIYENLRNILVETAFDQKTIKVLSYKGHQVKPLFRQFYLGRSRGTHRYVSDNSKASKLKKTIIKDEYDNLTSLYSLPYRDRQPGAGDTTYYDYFDKPYSPYIVVLWTGYKNRYGSSFNGNVELYKYINAESHTELAKYIRDYFYDIGFQITAISDQVYKIDFRMTGGDKDFVITKTAGTAVDAMTIDGDGNVGIGSTPTHGKVEIAREDIEQFLAPANSFGDGANMSMSLEDMLGHADASTLGDTFVATVKGKDSAGSSTSAFTDGKVRFGDLVYGINPRDNHPSRFFAKPLAIRSTMAIDAESKVSMMSNPIRVLGYGYWLTVLPAPNVYYTNWQTKKGKQKGSSLFFETEITIWLSEEVFANLESIEIEPLPVRKDF